MSSEGDADRPRRISQVRFDYEAQPLQQIVACNLCGNASWTIITHRDRYGYPASSSVCQACSLTVLNPRMTRDAYADFYRVTYRKLVSAYHGRLINADTLKSEQQSYARDVLSFLLWICPDGREWETLLDIGGSTGVVAACLASELGVKPTLIDPSPDEAHEASKFGIETIVGFAEDGTGDSRQFDLVGMFQTVDHLLDVRLALNNVRNAMADGGLFVVDIVDFRAAYLRAWSVEDATKIDHPFSFTQTTIELYFQRLGFNVVAKSFSRDHLHVVYACKKARPDEAAIPATEGVQQYLAELRYVQNAPYPVI